jgi:hypothetical protein
VLHVAYGCVLQREGCGMRKQNRKTLFRPSTRRQIVGFIVDYTWIAMLILFLVLALLETARLCSLTR